MQRITRCSNGNSSPRKTPVADCLRVGFISRSAQHTHDRNQRSTCRTDITAAPELPSLSPRCRPDGNSDDDGSRNRQEHCAGALGNNGGWIHRADKLAPLEVEPPSTSDAHRAATDPRRRCGVERDLKRKATAALGRREDCSLVAIAHNGLVSVQPSIAVEISERAVMDEVRSWRALGQNRDLH